jgi:outer membrane lipoprotein-sorting protein
MSNVPDLVGLLYRADWTRLSMTAEVNTSRERNPFQSGPELGEADEPGRADEPGGAGRGFSFGPMGGPWGEGPWGEKARGERARGRSSFGGRRRPWWAGREWEVAADLLQVDSGRSTLLIAPSGRYRQQGEDFISGCDGDRSWQAVKEDGDWVVESTLGPHTPLPTLLRPSWLLTGYDLEIGEPVTVCGRDALRVVATPRPERGDRTAPGLRRLDRVEVIVDAELGILLRREDMADGRPVNLTELENISLDPALAADDTQFRPPAGWDGAADNTEPGPLGWRPDGPGWETAKLAAGLAAAGLGALIRRQPADPFKRATQEEPEAEMPTDEPAPPDGSPVSDEVLHLLHRSQDIWASPIVATMHQWHDIAALLSRVPDRVRKAGFGGIGSLLDVAGERMSTTHTVARLRIAGPRTYRIDFDPQTLGSGKHRLKAIVCDGERRWRIYYDEATVADAEPPPREITDLLNSSWLLEHQLSGGSHTVAGGRLGYRLNVATDDQPWGGMFSPDEVVVDAESGIVLRWTSHLGARAMARCELRDVVANPAEPGDFQPGIAPGTRVVEESGTAEDGPDGDGPDGDGPDGDGPEEAGDGPPPGGTPGKMVGDMARQAAGEAKTAVRGLLDLIRGGDAR